MSSELPLPDHYNPDNIAKNPWKIQYQRCAQAARSWSEKFEIKPAHKDEKQTHLLLVDVQNTFCTPGFELFVPGAPDDNKRLTEFIYRSLNRITSITASMDTHFAMQIFHEYFFIDENGKHPEPLTIISLEDIKNGKWKVNPEILPELEKNKSISAEDHVAHYVKELEKKQRYSLVIWPYHAMLGGIGHALVSSVEEAIFFHNIARKTQANIEIKGSNFFSEAYSIFGEEVQDTPNPASPQERMEIAEKNERLIEHVIHNDKIIVAGQAKSHCVAWTLLDLMQEIKEKDPKLADKVYILEDCMSPVPGFEKQTEEIFKEIAESGMHLVSSKTDMKNWP